MFRAYDTLLQTVVSADSAAANSDNEAFRYECLRCGEEVFLAAQDSTYRSTHFRHRSGNNDKDCELYLGQYGLVSVVPGNRKSKQERVEFYYDNSHKAFYLCLRFSEAEIIAYEESGINFEIRDLRTSQPFFSRTINHTNFCDDVPEMFMLERYASPYYISNTANKIKREYYVFSDRRPAFFKVQGDSEDYKAKYIKGSSLYTDVKYFVAWPGQNTAQIRLGRVQGIDIGDSFQFKTMNNCTVWGMKIVFKEKNPKLDELLQLWGYNLSVSEKLTLLWPPAFENNETKNISSSKAYLFSSFSFQGYGNININDDAIHCVSNGITRIDIKDKVKILKKNAEMSISINDKMFPNDTVIFSQICADHFKIPNDGDYYRFSSHGVEKLVTGQVVYLTPKSYIAEYRGNYLIKRISMQTVDEMSLEEKIRDALSHYWIMAPCDDMDNSNLPEIIQEYLSNCQSNGYINQAVKKIVAEGNYD